MDKFNQGNKFINVSGRATQSKILRSLSEQTVTRRLIATGDIEERESASGVAKLRVVPLRRLAVAAVASLLFSVRLPAGASSLR